MTLPVLYSLRHCPFAMRARLAIFKSQQAVELRDVKLTNKPKAMLIASPKGTVPILVVSPGHLIDESLEVMLWVLTQNDPDNLLYQSGEGGRKEDGLSDLLSFINDYDHTFKACLERYKCAKRYHEPDLVECRQACEKFVADLEQRLTTQTFIFGAHESLADIAILPFIRQFAKVERSWYVQSQAYSNVKRWLNQYLQSAMFNKVMAQYPIWQEGNDPVVFAQ